MKHFGKLKMAAAVLACSAGMASAATVINPGDEVLSVGGIVTAGNGSSFQYDYQVSDDLFVREFALSAVGFNGGDDIEKIIASLTHGGGSSVTLEAMLNPDTDAGQGRVTFGGQFLNGMSFVSGDTFSILFRVADGKTTTSNVGVQTSFTAVDAPAPVPVPAAGALLLTALLSGGVVARRKKKAD
ncbi:putative secreted protein with PEP-CTERM sorting signal [Palleronia aestuarii]|uniref:Putative secreted protein with PEP-CTERM sorting signal n=1 Tax=Palleronia aestuarii TaxID=568105 RepID=A0A2W7N8H0_9RHOB|nr:PEP-CTERM sorting domain-containing protein [Palleronia aestuarii]PZX16471.1 putative secreted protein with PEP-CTERM sorting signal [Palleronia aestuarii]